MVRGRGRCNGLGRRPAHQPTTYLGIGVSVNGEPHSVPAGATDHRNVVEEPAGNGHEVVKIWLADLNRYQEPRCLWTRAPASYAVKSRGNSVRATWPLTSATPRLVEVVAIYPSGTSSDGGEAVHEVRTRRRLDLVSEMHLGGKRGRRVHVTPIDKSVSVGGCVVAGQMLFQPETRGRRELRVSSTEPPPHQSRPGRRYGRRGQQAAQDSQSLLHEHRCRYMAAKFSPLSSASLIRSSQGHRTVLYFR